MRLASVNRFAIVFCAASISGSGAELPPWWKAFIGVPRIQAAFVQTSDSAVFGKLKRKGSVRLAKAGRLRVVYEDGLELIADGQSLIQYDPDTRTAQSMDLSEAAIETPLLRLLTDRTRLGNSYTIESSANGQVRLKPLKKGLPEVRIDGSGSLPKRLAWTDASGAGQVLEFLDARVPGREFPAETFRFHAPTGTRWLGKQR